MRRLRRIINIFMWGMGCYRRPGPERIPKHVAPADLERALEEARFLFRTHGVDVKSLAPGEVADMPKPADGHDVPQRPIAEG